MPEASSTPIASLLERQGTRLGLSKDALGLGEAFLDGARVRRVAHSIEVCKPLVSTTSFGREPSMGLAAVPSNVENGPTPLGFTNFQDTIKLCEV